MSLLVEGRRWIKKSLLGSGALRLASHFAGRGVAIVMYHSVVDKPERQAKTIGMGHTTAVFQGQMEVLARNYNPVTLEDVMLFLSGQKPMPARPVAVTFDDGYADNYEVAAPLLNRLGVPATFYVTVDCIEKARPPWFCSLRFAVASTEKEEWSDPEGGVHQLRSPAEREKAFLAACRNCARLTGETQEAAVRAIESELDVEPLDSKQCPMLSWDQVRRLARDGHVVGSHTLTHPNLAHVGDEELARELVESKHKLEKELGADAIHFSYPNPILVPHWTERTLSASQQAGYRTAVVATTGLVREEDDPLCFRRVSPTQQVDGFHWNLERTFLRGKTLSSIRSLVE